jgi:ABC-type uncharacterized transport system fused permease/ATPase subunit
VLWSISPSLVYFLLLYTGFGTTALTWIFGRPLMRLYYKSLNTEADMRFSLVRVRENAESIAFYGGEGRERQVCVGGGLACLVQRAWCLVPVPRHSLRHECSPVAFAASVWHCLRSAGQSRCQSELPVLAMQVVMGRLGLVVAVALQRIKWQSMYELWSRVYSWATILIPPMLTAPRCASTHSWLACAVACVMHFVRVQQMQAGDCSSSSATML